MLKRSDIKKMYVWDNNYEKKELRYILFKNEDGSCVAVNSYHEEEYENHGSFSTIKWLHFEPIPEPQYRIMTRNEVLKFVLENHDKILVKSAPSDRDWHIGTSYLFTPSLEEYLYITIDELGNDEQPKKFEIEDSDD